MNRQWATTLRLVKKTMTLTGCLFVCIMLWVACQFSCYITAAWGYMASVVAHIKQPYKPLLKASTIMI